MTDGSPAADDGQRPGAKPEELMAAVRAVEKGERPAAEFFAAPAPTPRRRAAPAPGGPGRARARAAGC
ncbi:hypothetical protein, partial [Streptomyces lonarensis]